MELFISPAQAYIVAIPADFLQPPDGSLSLIISGIALPQTLINREILTKKQAFEKTVECWIGASFSRWEASFKLFADPLDTAQGPIEGISFSDQEIQNLIGSYQSFEDIAERISEVLTGGVMGSWEKYVLAH